MESRTPSIIDLNAELAKLTMFRGLTPQSTRAERKGQRRAIGLLPRRAPFRGQVRRDRPLGDAIPTTSWFTSSTAATTLEIVCDDGPPKSFALRAGMIAVVPQGAWHRFRSSEGKTHDERDAFPGDHIELDVDDPRTSTTRADMAMRTRPPSIIDLNAELAKLTMFRDGPRNRRWRIEREAPHDWRPTATAPLASRSSRGKVIGNRHLAGDELIHILDGTATLEIVGDDGPQSFALRAGMIAVIPQGAWHRFRSVGGRDADGRDTLSRARLSSSMSTTLGRSSASRHEQRVLISTKEGGISDGHAGHRCTAGTGPGANYAPGRSFALKLRGGETGGSIMMFEETVPRRDQEHLPPASRQRRGGLCPEWRGHLPDRR